MYRDNGSYDMEYRGFYQMCWKAWTEKLNFPYIDMTRDETERKCCIFNESKNTYIECMCGSEVL